MRLDLNEETIVAYSFRILFLTAYLSQQECTVQRQRAWSYVLCATRRIKALCCSKL